ncbi:MAG: SIMPL domain-containing protein [Boseongicola sp.]|nr:SIMPL domain-containing protein [Boseongicola sp.]MDD9979417.1 SIMPL domain-containing protein [Boseongicola sp.]
MRIFLVVFTVLALNSGVLNAEDSRREIVVIGEGRVSASPDMATIQVGVQRNARTAGEAMRLTSTDASNVLAKLKELGVEDRDIQTTNISLSPRFQRSNDGSPPRVTGYIASNSLSVRVRDLDDLGGLLDQVVGQGTNTLNGVFFSVADPDPLRDQARELAVKNARSKAELLASAAGVEVGDVLEINELGGGGSMPLQRSVLMEASDAVPIAAGEIDFNQSVTVIFKIAEE